MTLLLMSLLLLCPWLVAQGPPAKIERQRVVGRVLDRQGKPWVGAEVTLFARQVPTAPDGGWIDVIQVRSGERGRFSARLVSGLLYSAYAVQEVEGRVRATLIRDHVFAGQPVELREGRSNRRVSCQLGGQEAWKDQGPLRFEVRLEPPGSFHREVEVVDGSLRLPPLPGGHAVLRILDGKRRFITTRSLDLDPAHPLEVLPLLPPYEVVLRCRAGAGDEAPPLVGARVFVFNHRSLEPHGRTDAQGRIRLWLQKHPKLPRSPVKRMLLVLAPGYSEALVPLVTDSPVLNARVGKRDEKRMDLVYHARPSRSLRGVLLDKEGKPLADKRLLLRSELFPVRRRADLNEWVRVPREHRSDAQGRFEVPLPDRLPESRSALLCLSYVEGAQETILYTGEIGEPAPSKQLVCRISDLIRLSLHFRELQEGQQLLCHYVPVGAGGWRKIPQAFLGLARGRGSIDLTLPPGRYVFAFESPGLFLHEEIRIEEGRRHLSMDLAFSKTRRISGRVREAGGKPVAGVELRWQPMVPYGRRQRRSRRSPLADELVFNLVKTEKDGSFDFVLPADAGEFQLSATWRKSAGSIWHSPTLHYFRPGKKDLLDLSLELRTR